MEKPVADHRITLGDAAHDIVILSRPDRLTRVAIELEIDFRGARSIPGDSHRDRQEKKAETESEAVNGYLIP